MPRRRWRIRRATTHPTPYEVGATSVNADGITCRIRNTGGARGWCAAVVYNRRGRAGAMADRTGDRPVRKEEPQRAIGNAGKKGDPMNTRPNRRPGREGGQRRLPGSGSFGVLRGVLRVSVGCPLVSVNGSESQNHFPAEWREILVESGFASDLRKMSRGLISVRGNVSCVPTNRDPAGSAPGYRCIPPYRSPTRAPQWRPRPRR